MRVKRSGGAVFAGLLAACVWMVVRQASAAAAGSPAAGPGAACSGHALASARALARGDYQAAGKDFAPAIARQFPPAKIRQAWDSVQASAGGYQRLGEAEQRRIDGRPVVVIPVGFSHAPWVFVYACNGDNEFTTARLMPATQLDEAAAAERKAAQGKIPIKPRTLADGVRVEPLSVPSPYGPLRGVLTLPAGKGPFPAMVLVGGSGPNDLDEAVGGSRPFRDIAEGLAAVGIASLRYEKRQTDYPFRMAADASLTVDQEETDDALTAARLLSRQAGVDPNRVFVLGHSQGGMLVPRIGRRDPALAGIIMMAAPARKLLAVMREQTREQGQRLGLPKDQVKKSEQALAAEQKLLDAANPDHPPAGSFAGAPQSWWLSVHDYDQVAVAESLSMPILVLQGGSDFQVSPTLDFDAWKRALAGRSNVTLHLYPGLSHLFTPAGRSLTTADYARPAHVDPAVIREIAAWINSQRSPG